MGDKRRILFLTISGKTGASSRYRVYQFLPHIEAAGFGTTVMPPSPRQSGLARLIGGIVEDKRILKAAAGSDVVFIQKRLFGAGLIASLKKLGKPIVFDYDDSIFTSPSGSWSVLTRHRVESRLKAVISAADTVITGNRFLAEHARSSGARKVVVLPTAVELDKYTVKEHRPGPVSLGWIGSSVNYRYLDMLSGVLPAIAARHNGLKLIVVADRDYSMNGIEVDNRRWSEQTEVADLMDMDIGLMPLADDVWTRGKCALKALQYMACGIPAVCSPVGANNEVVSDGRDGFLPGTDAAWLDRLSGLAASHELRTEMGARARAKVHAGYSTDAIGGRLAELLGMP